jgi:hypothetical protein
MALWWSWGGGLFMSEVPLYSAFLQWQMFALRSDDVEPSSGSYRSTSLMRKRHPVEPYSRIIPRLLWWC